MHACFSLNRRSEGSGTDRRRIARCPPQAALWKRWRCPGRWQPSAVRPEHSGCSPHCPCARQSPSLQTTHEMLHGKISFGTFKRTSNLFCCNPRSLPLFACCCTFAESARSLRRNLVCSMSRPLDLRLQMSRQDSGPRNALASHG